MRQIDVLPTDDSLPKIRNSHTMCASSKAAYIFGGANCDGPMGDLHEFNFETEKFRRVKLDTSEVQLPAIEMHTSHIW